jgi:dinuclear metal center YbgI/SA1388 family protein
MKARRGGPGLHRHRDHLVPWENCTVGPKIIHRPDKILPMILKDLLIALDQIAPVRNAESWDNVGLLAGDPGQTIRRILVTIDYTNTVAAEARNLNCDCIIAYHPPLFSAVKRITSDGPTALIHDAIRRGIAIYSPHTAWDATPGGTNDFLADCLDLIEVAPLLLNSNTATELKLVTFVPQVNVDAVSAALFAAGAGHIGDYNSCSFRSAGTGTFFGEPGTNPAIGQPGQFEIQPEIRMETIFPIAKMNAIIRALLASHPYEEPAYDLTMLAAQPTGIGQGRVGNLPVPMPIESVIDRIKTELNIPGVLLTGPEKRTVHSIAICAGSGGDLLDAAIAAKADVFLTGELRHHDALKAASAGMNVICTLHSNCERPSLTRLKARLDQLPAPRPEVILSQADRDPFSIR